MREKKGEWRRKHAGSIVAIAALLLLALIVLPQIRGPRGRNAVNREDRIGFLASLGWEVEPDAEEADSVLIPDCGTGAMAEYNELMKRGGYDLSPYAGKKVERYSYVLSNYPGCEDTVYLTLYVSRGRVIGGDIHTASLNGFMHELRARE